MLAARLALAFLAQSPAPAPVDSLVERADAIVLARVAALHPLKGTELRLAELDVERGFFAAPGERVFAMPPTTKSSKKANVLELGRSYVVFLERRLAEPTVAQARSAEPLLGGASVYTWLAWWPADAESVTIPAGQLPATGGPSGVARAANGDSAPRAELVAWLEQRIERSLPSVRVWWLDTGPNPEHEVRVGPNGTTRGRGATKPQLTRAEWDALIRLLDDERFYELPDHVGDSQGPCAGTGKIEVRTARGRKLVLVVGWYLERLSPAEREAAERALRVWCAMPWSFEHGMALDSVGK